MPTALARRIYIVRLGNGRYLLDVPDKIDLPSRLFTTDRVHVADSEAEDQALRIAIKDKFAGIDPAADELDIADAYWI